MVPPAANFRPNPNPNPYFLMKINPWYFVAALVLAVGLPSSNVRSQLLAPATDPLIQIQTLGTANDDLLKRQEATLKELTDMTDTAREVRIYSRRG